jgi:DNA invertase Pin-like site-specific DNA recombinase
MIQFDSMKQAIAYLRTSTDKKTQNGINQDGFSFDSQMAAIQKYINSQPDTHLVATYAEQTSGFNNDRVELAKALDHVKSLGNDAFIICSKIDRLSRSAAFIIEMSDKQVPFVIAEMPNASSFTLHIMALVAQNERENIKSRVRESMAAGKKAGRRYGTPQPTQCVALMAQANRNNAAAYKNKILPIIKQIKEVAKVETLAGIANILNIRGIKTRTGKMWHPATIKLYLD